MEVQPPHPATPRIFTPRIDKIANNTTELFCALPISAGVRGQAVFPHTEKRLFLFSASSWSDGRDNGQSLRWQDIVIDVSLQQRELRDVLAFEMFSFCTSIHLKYGGVFTRVL